MTLEALKALANNPKNKALMAKYAADDNKGHLFIGRPGCMLCGTSLYHMFDMDPSEGFGHHLRVCPDCLKKALAC